MKFGISDIAPPRPNDFNSLQHFAPGPVMAIAAPLPQNIPALNFNWGGGTTHMQPHEALNMRAPVPETSQRTAY